MYNNKSRLSAHHTLLPNMYHDNRVRLSAHHTLLPNMHHETEAGSLLTTPCYLTCTMITEAGSLLTTPCYLTCTMITETGSLLTTPCYQHTVYYRSSPTYHGILKFLSIVCAVDFVSTTLIKIIIIVRVSQSQLFCKQIKYNKNLIFLHHDFLHAVSDTYY